ncbi:AFG1 family ATPase [Haliea sp. AH-315-K21]|uniref:Cell division protein ZapE n=1 Tax=SAR86 cluster bacterium TaxID=2030880 RepID=A0A2A5CB27_9GAMM|nr:AFG1 family ATPase [Haliea sp. AH-315-K21]PCJ40711.1 MAG: cell division protein ZapE [SAR86 cluster bacterium]
MQRYQQDISEGSLVSDASQLMAVKELQIVFEALLLRRKQSEKATFFEKISPRLFATKASPIKGLYFWGGVGRGKTYLMDLFFQCLPEERKMRMHFHRFMLMVNNRLNTQASLKNPLQEVARSIAQEVDIICFDEFFVTDIGDAMILAGLLETLFNSGVILITTSNIEPKRLYENGLQRENFLPAIELLKQYTKVVNVDGGVDYRLRSLEQAEIYHSPLGGESEIIMLESFKRLSAGLNTVADGTIEIQGRKILSRYRAEDLVWFDFENICGGPRSPADYIEIAQLFHTVLISDIPELDGYSDDKARRFVSLVDEFYDHKVKLIISAATLLQDIYQGRELRFVFERAKSRLLEMQSHEYLALEHSP